MSCGLHDSVRLEERGIPVAMLVTDAFVDSVAEQLAAISCPTFEPVYVPHPVASLPRAEVHHKADQALGAIASRLARNHRATAAAATEEATVIAPRGGEPEDAARAAETCPVDAGPDCEVCAVEGT